MLRTIFSTCCLFAVSYIARTTAQMPYRAQYQGPFQPYVPPVSYGKTQGASLSSAPVGLYSRKGVLGDMESASSLGGAPVGIYNKRHNEFPQVYGYPSYPVQYPIQPPYIGRSYPYPPPRYPPALVNPIRPPPPYPPVLVNPIRPPPRPVRPTKRPVKPTTKPGVNPRLLGGLLGGGLFGGLL